MHTLPAHFFQPGVFRPAAALIAAFAVALLAACAVAPPPYDPIITEVPLDGIDAPADDGLIEVSDSYIYEEDTGGLSDADLLAKRVIYFDYDSSLLSELGDSISQRHSRYLSEDDADARIILAGHADERGTREYNLALAEDRAKTVADVLQALGVDGGRIQVVSYGEERPAALGHDETSWSQNRRVEILYE